MAKKKKIQLGATGAPFAISTGHSFWIPAQGTQGGLQPREVDGTYYGYVEVLANDDVVVHITDFSGSFTKASGDYFPFAIAAWPDPFEQNCGYDQTPAVRVGRHYYGFHGYPPGTGVPGTAYFPFEGTPAGWGSADIKSGTIGKLSQLPHYEVKYPDHIEMFSSFDILGYGFYEEPPTQIVAIRSKTFTFKSEEIIRFYYPMAVYNSNSRKYISCDDKNNGCQIISGNTYRDVKNKYSKDVLSDGQGLIVDNVGNVYKFRNQNKYTTTDKKESKKKTTKKKESK